MIHFSESLFIFVFKEKSMTNATARSAHGVAITPTFCVASDLIGALAHQSVILKTRLFLQRERLE
jgi:hypothetical protein